MGPELGLVRPKHQSLRPRSPAHFGVAREVVSKPSQLFATARLSSITLALEKLSGQTQGIKPLTAKALQLQPARGMWPMGLFRT